MDTPTETKFIVAVDGHALRRVLVALNGPGHMIRELQNTRDSPPVFTGNPIDTLIDNFNAAVNVLGVPKT